MKATSGTTIAALLAFAFLGSASPAQQTAPAAEQAQPAENSAGAPAAETGTGATTEAVSRPSNSSFADSKVRIVRLSQVNGPVQMDRNTGQGFETAMQNLPVTEGTKLKTDTGFAEIEFEDNSTLRATPGTLIEFPQLELRPTGAKATTVNVLQGTVYVSLASTKGSEFTLTFGPEKVTLPPSSHVRLEMGSPKAALSVFEGSAQVAGASAQETLEKKRTLTFNLADQSQPTLAKNVAENEFDDWDHQGNEYHKQYANASAFGNAPYSYGASDMNYYGSFLDAGGCGSMWRPYFASASWDPFGSGVWAWYSGAGYSWVSPYPWGWMPYHYGSWSFCPGVGWGWQPGGAWTGLSNAPGTFNPRRPLHGGNAPSFPVQPTHAPVGRSTLMPVNLEKLSASGLGAHDSFTFRNDSAGLGVPRGSLGKLDKLSVNAAQHGAVSKPVYTAPISTAAANGRMENGNPSMRQGVNGGAGQTGRASSERVGAGSGAPGSGGPGRMGTGPGGMGAGSSGVGAGPSGMGAGSPGHGGGAGAGPNHR